MALKQLRYHDMLNKKRESLKKTEQQKEQYRKVLAHLNKRLAETKTDNEVEAVSAQSNDLVLKLEENAERLEELKEEIKFLEEELHALENGMPTGETETIVTTENGEIKKGGKRKMTNQLNFRNTATHLKNEKVRSFYDNVKRTALEKRSFENGGLAVPVEVIDNVLMLIGDYTNLYAEVDVQVIQGEARVILDGAIPEAIWTEMTGAINELETGVNHIELDGYKLGGYVSVPNAFLDDSLVKLSMYVEQRLAQAIAKALDKAILNGTGATDKQPEGVIPSIPVENKATIDGTQVSILSSMALLDTGETETGEIIAVMKRKTYYQHILPQSIVNTADGRQMVQGVDSPNIAGLRVVFSQNAPADSIVLGDFKQYLLSERANVIIQSSEHVKFTEDQRVFKGVARYDGKVKNADSFALLTIVNE